MQMRFTRQFTVLFITASAAGITGCGEAGDSLRNWGQRERWNRAKEINQDDLAQWQKDLEISEDKVRELYKNIQLLTQESAHQGNVSWKIAKAYAEQGRFELAEEHYKRAVEDRQGGFTERPAESDPMWEKSLPFYKNALKKHTVSKDLLYDAGLAYANASRASGWSGDRWDTAVYLLGTVMRMDPDDVRPYYPLALLYGKTTDESRRDTAEALKLLDTLILRQNQDVAARFAKANILAETGDFDRALSEYRNIKQIIEDMHNTGVLKGSIDRNIKYQKASENIIRLERCLNDNMGCELGSPEP